MAGFLDRLLKGAKPAQDKDKQRESVVDSEATPAGVAVRLEPRTENTAEHSYPAYRLLVALVMMLTATVLVLAGTIIAMMPLRTIETKFLHIAEQGKQVYVVEPLNGSSYQRVDAVFENVAKQYVLLRHEVIEIPFWMSERWLNRRDFIGSYSYGPIWNRFVEQAKPLIEEMRERPYRRKVEIERITRAQGEGWRYTVIFETTDSAGALEISDAVTRRFEASIEMRQGNYGPKPDVDWARVNPFGIFVTGYDVRELKGDATK